MGTLIRLSVLVLGAAGFVFAGVATPEIDANTGVAAVALLSGGLVVLWGWRRAK